MYEEFDGSGSAPPRSVADPGLLDSVRMSFIGLLSKLSPPADYEPLLEDTRDSGDGSPPCCGEAKVLFSTDDSTISGAVDWHSARQKSFYLNSSSMGACVLNLISTIVGSGILGLPFALSKSGWSLGIFLIFGCSLSGLFAMSLLASCAFKSQPFSIQSVLKDSSMYYCVLVEISQLISCFGACLSYLAVIGGTMSSLVGGLGVSHTIWSHHKIWVVVGFLVVAPACFIDKLDTLKYTSGVSLALISFVAGIIFMFSLDTQTFDPCGSGGDDCSSETHALTTTWDTLRALSIFVFAFSGTQNIFHVMNELTDPIPKRTTALIASASSVVLVLYLFVAICGYATYGTNVQSNVLRSAPNTIGYGFARIFATICAAFAFPVQFFPARNALLALIDMVPICRFKDGVADSTELKLRLAIVVSILLLLVFTVALLVSDLAEILSFFGSCTIVIGYIFPGASYYSMSKESYAGPPWMRIGSVVLLILGCVLFPLSVYSVVYRYSWV